ncbi:MAG: hypothetical protein NT138_27050 [Planctomycetales bacterium]|jgi:hypothetical protein|nr:hypothetical protein [Planctomycetales bacterium]
MRQARSDVSIEGELSRWGNSITNLECWGVIANSVGSWFSLHLGEKILRPKPIPNSRLTADEQNFDSAFGLFVTTSPWILHSEGQWVVDSGADGSIGGPIDKGLDLIRGTRVQAVMFAAESSELTIQFSPGTMRLQIFPDRQSETEGGYCVFFPDHSVSILLNGRGEIQNY